MLERHAPRRPRATLAAASVAVLATASIALALAGCGSVFGGGTMNTAGKVHFDTPLPIPPVAKATTDAAGERVFTLAASAGSTEFRPGERTTTWGYNGSYLGPTIVANRGDAVRVDVTNRLTVPTTVHWHGMHLPAAMDGGPHQMVSPGETWSPHWRIDQPAATLWYHPHPHGETLHQVTMGLAGMVILHDEAEEALNLPREYGVDDIPVIVQDRRFDDGGQFTNSTSGFIGPIGDTVLVNGAIGAYLPVTTDVVRLRLLNASAARIYDFGFSDHRSFELIGTDGGLLAAPAAMTGIRLSPGERAEVLVRMEPGERVTLRSTPPKLGVPDSVATMNAGRDTLDIMQLRAADSLTSLGPMPTELVPMARWDAADASVTCTFDMHGTRINDQRMQMDRIDQTVVVDTLEKWVVTNSQNEPHSFHVHDTQFQVASVGGAPPPPELAGWKDTVYLAPETAYVLLLRFSDYTDRNIPYMYHCHLLRHEDGGMMGQFVVVKAGQKAGTPPEDSTEDRSGYGPRENETNHEH
ncbi:multicopper oxidase domain-containing protein [Microbacterium sp. STN6]|uniref:multicopper oxidase family protein n=1 Tax=Microbacterium sp. STN6 TaxID=2995588 RepID=UPI002260C73B|nr:multicopper oxidase domain-containing protein [Microbacterium sp. STN6]MCX7522207.1 multicopper oxidase domain-containing protein [Microbacterium sp. STN6]